MIRIFSGQPPQDDYLAHFGINGMKWGVRRYQNPDGTLTEEGKKRYGVGSAENAVSAATDLLRRKNIYDKSRKAANIMAGAGAITGVAGLLLDKYAEKPATALLATAGALAAGSVIPNFISMYQKDTISEIQTQNREHVYDENSSDYDEYSSTFGKSDGTAASISKVFKGLKDNLNFGEMADVTPGLWDFDPNDRGFNKAFSDEFHKADSKFVKLSNKYRDRSELKDFYMYTHAFPLRLDAFRLLMEKNRSRIPSDIDGKIDFEAKMWEEAWDQVVRTVSNDDSFDYIMADLAKRQKELEF